MNFWCRVGLFFAAAAVLAAAEPVLKISASAKSLTLTAAEFAALPHREIVAADPHGKKDHHYTGVPVVELLSRVEAPLGEKLRGPALQLVVIVHSTDGYAVAFSLAEFDEAFGDRTILLADREDNQPLPENAAPFRLIVAGDKRAARWARMVSSIDLVAVNSLPVASGRP
jgi:hypothetical protein